MIIATATQMKNSFGRYLKLALENGEIFIEKNGTIVARLIADRKANSFISTNLKGIAKEKNNESDDSF